MSFDILSVPIKININKFIIFIHHILSIELDISYNEF